MENLNRNNNQFPYSISYSTTKDGKLQVDFIDYSKKPFDQFYDTTRLIVDANNPLINRDYTALYDCAVSHYGQDDAVYLDGNKEFGRKNQYKDVQAEFNLALLQTDPTYCAFVMKALLNEKRLDKYLNDGLKNNPKIPCGNYVGAVLWTEQGYKKFFREDDGISSHFSEKMISKRLELMKRRQNSINRQLEDLDKKRAQLLAERDRNMDF